jgi:hypothetical protein
LYPPSVTLIVIALTVIVIVVCAVALPHVPVTVVVYVPTGTVPSAAIVALKVARGLDVPIWACAGENCTVSPCGAGLPFWSTVLGNRRTVPVKPPMHRILPRLAPGSVLGSLIV